jgi:NodT family efflux transporter outer membrane factor (OMF) lipoprotein
MPVSHRFFASLVAAGAVAGCTVGPDYQRPTVAAPARFIGQSAIEQRPVATVADLGAWWTGFDDPLLARFVSLALEQNLDIAQAAARVAQSRAALRVADSALLPRGDLTAQAQKVYQSVDTPLGRLLDSTPGFSRNAAYYEGDAGASWELDLFGGLRRNREAVRAEYEASAAAAVATRLAIAAQTADTYVTIRGLQARLAVARQQADTRRRLLATVQMQYDTGVAAALQVRQTEGALAQVEAAVPVLEAGLDAALNALDVLVGAQPGTYRPELNAAAPIPIAPRLAHTGTPGDLIRRRPDLIVAERRLAAANARIGAAIAEYYPKLSLSGLLGTAATASGNLFTHGATQAQGILGLRWRLFDFGRVDAQIAAARGRTSEALAAYRLAVLRASAEVEDTFSALVKREHQMRALQQGEIALARARETSFAAYRGGVVSLIEVLDADSHLLQTRDAMAQAQADAARAAIASFRALGGGWDVASDTRSGAPLEVSAR